MAKTFCTVMVIVVVREEHVVVISIMSKRSLILLDLLMEIEEIKSSLAVRLSISSSFFKSIKE
jgi:hypothetical protein